MTVQYLQATWQFWKIFLINPVVPAACLQYITFLEINVNFWGRVGKSLYHFQPHGLAQILPQVYWNLRFFEDFLKKKWNLLHERLYVFFLNLRVKLVQPGKLPL
jgi:hypothetical protein